MLGVRQMAEGLMLVYGWGPEEDGRLSTLIYIAETAAAMDMKTSVFLFTDAGILAKKGTVAKMGEEIDARFKSILRSEQVKFYVCEEAARKRGVKDDDIEDNLKMIGYATFLDMATKAETIITI
jgi:predicted peroxiredoxin